MIFDWQGFDAYSLPQKSGQNRLIFVLMSHEAIASPPPQEKRSPFQSRTLERSLAVAKKNAID